MHDLPAAETKRLVLAREFFETTARSHFERLVPDLFDKAAYGLFGEGSECYGLDDEISYDHNDGIRLQVLLDEDTSSDDLMRFRDAFLALPDTWRGLPVTKETFPFRAGLVLFRPYIDLLTEMDMSNPTEDDWRRASEIGLSKATNGDIFFDPPGHVTALRKHLLAFYPEPVRIEKLARALFEAGQIADYNYWRTCARADRMSAAFMMNHYADAVLRALYLFARIYRPFYKWQAKLLYDRVPYDRPVLDTLFRIMHADPGTERDVIRAGFAEITETLINEMLIQNLISGTTRNLIYASQEMAGIDISEYDE